MDINEDALYEELKELCWGRGARDPSKLHSMSPELRYICEIAKVDQPDEMAEKLRRATVQLMPPEGRELVLTALGLGEAKQDSLDNRIQWLAERRHVSERTLKRWRKKYLKVFAAAAAAEAEAISQSQDVGYVVEEYYGIVKYLGDRITQIQRRRIRPTRDLETIRCGVKTTPKTNLEIAEVTIRVTSGGQLDGNASVQGSVVKFRVAPPEPLNKGTVHEFEVEIGLPSTAQTQPFHVVQPYTHFGWCKLEAWFDPCSLPASVWRVDGVLPGEIEGGSPEASMVLPLDPSGRVQVEFSPDRQGMMYGLVWRWT